MSNKPMYDTPTMYRIVEWDDSEVNIHVVHYPGDDYHVLRIMYPDGSCNTVSRSYLELEMKPERVH
jgi:hypothetical protein